MQKGSAGFEAMPRTIQTPKRKCTEITSPENLQTAKPNMESSELIDLIKDTINNNLDDKLKMLPTKSDLEDIKQEITSIGSEINSLKAENQNLREELNKVKKENAEQKKDITWLQNQIRSNKIFIKGLISATKPMDEVRKLFRETLKITADISNVRKVFERNGKMAVLVELGTPQAIDEVFRNTKNLAGTNISVERDLIPKRQQQKKAFLGLRKQILAVSKQYKILVRDDKLKINNIWFKWNNENKLICGNSNGEEELVKLYGENIKSININFNQLSQNLFSKN